MMLCIHAHSLPSRFRYMEILRPIPSDGGSFHLKSSLVGVHSKGKGALVESLSELVDENGNVYVKLISGAFVVGAKDFTPAGVTHSLNIAVCPFLI